MHHWDTQVLQKQLVLAFLVDSSQVPKEAPRMNWQMSLAQSPDAGRATHCLTSRDPAGQEQGLAGLVDQAWGWQGDLHFGA